MASGSQKNNGPTFSFSGTPTITSEKLNGRNYLAWSSSVELWFLGQGNGPHTRLLLFYLWISKSETSEMKFSEADYQEYLQLKACISQFGHDQSPWIIDSGASDHIAGNGSLFSSISSNKNPHFITLADGSRVAAKGIGHASPTTSLSLSSVLFIPGCPFNLISLSQLTRSHNCSVTFDANSFVIQPTPLTVVIDCDLIDIKD